MLENCILFVFISAMEDCLHLLFCTLDELEVAKLGRFRAYLSEKNVDGLEPIPRGEMENADSTVVAFKMKEAYGEKRSVEVTLNILRKMNLNCVADKLR